MRNALSVTQNFITNTQILRDLVRSAAIQDSDTVIDIGAGNGNVTAELLNYSSHVVAIEPDYSLFDQLRNRFGTNPHAELVCNTVEEYTFPSVQYKVFANIPFRSTSYIVKTLCGDKLFRSGLLFMQLEAAEKFSGLQIGAPGTLFSNIYGISHSFSIAHTFSSSDFSPQPHVTVVALSIERYKAAVVPPEVPAFKDFLAYVFNHAMPTMLTARRLLKKSDFAELHLRGDKRPSEWSQEEFYALFSYLRKAKRLNITNGYFQKTINEQSRLQKIHRTRTDTDWKRTGIMV